MKKYWYIVNTLFSNLMLASLAGFLAAMLVMAPALEPNGLIRSLEIAILSGISCWSVFMVVVSVTDETP